MRTKYELCCWVFCVYKNNLVVIIWSEPVRSGVVFTNTLIIMLVDGHEIVTYFKVFLKTGLVIPDHTGLLTRSGTSCRLYSLSHWVFRFQRLCSCKFYVHVVKPPSPIKHIVPNLPPDYSNEKVYDCHLYQRLVFHYLGFGILSNLRTFMREG